MQRQPEPLTPAQARQSLAQILMGEGDVPSLLGDVDGHHPLHNRVQGSAVGALAQHIFLSVVDRFLPGEDAEEERDRQRAGEHRQQRGQPAQQSWHTRHVGTDAIHHLLKHHGVVALFDGLVQQVAVLRRAVGHPEGVVHQAANQDRLELQADFRDVGLAPLTDLNLVLNRLSAVPRMAAQRVGRGEYPALV